MHETLISKYNNKFFWCTVLCTQATILRSTKVNSVRCSFHSFVGCVKIPFIIILMLFILVLACTWEFHFPSPSPNRMVGVALRYLKVRLMRKMVQERSETSM